MQPLALLQFAAVSALLFITPGFSFLALTRLWKDRPALQRWIVAIGISLAFYPVLFYLLREALPSLHLGPNKLWVLLAVMGGITLYYFWKERHTLFQFHPLEWISIGVVTLTILTRFWAIADLPFPAWSDALHHVLLTQLTAQNGQLPYTLAPYASTPMDMYHLGLYALSGPVQQLTGLPAHTAFLWTSQLLNGLCGLGLYLLLDRKVGRPGALVGLVAIGLWSFQPAWYVNWSRTTSLAANTILFVALVLTWEALSSMSRARRFGFPGTLGMLAGAGLLNAAIFLFHFRVAGYYLPLLALVCLYEWIRAAREHHTRQTLAAMLLVGILSILLILPALLRAFPAYYNLNANMPMTESVIHYFAFNLRGQIETGLGNGMTALALAMLLVALFLRNRLAPLALFWALFLFMEGYAYYLRIPLLLFTNAWGIAAILYLPASLMIGLGFGSLFARFERRGWKLPVQIGLAVLVTTGLFCIPSRVKGIESYRHFLKTEDLAAMDWIRVNTPADAVFAINTTYWAVNSPVGTDGGFWIPYLTHRFTTTSTMLSSLGPEHQQVLSRSGAVMALYEDGASLPALCDLGVDYLYNGELPSYTGQDFNVAELLEQSGVSLVYQDGNVRILKICSASGGQ